MYDWTVIARLTADRVERQILNNWTLRRLWWTKLDQPESGKARLYSRANVIEAAIADEMMRVGISRERVRGFLNWRALKANGDGGYAVSFDDLPEMARGSAEWWWLCLLVSEDGQQRIEMPTMAVNGRAALAEQISNFTGRAVVVVDIAGIVATVDAALGDTN